MLLINWEAYFHLFILTHWFGCIHCDCYNAHKVTKICLGKNTWCTLHIMVEKANTKLINGIFKWQKIVSLSLFFFPPFGSVHLLSCVLLCVIPLTATLQVSLSITNSRSLLKFMSIESKVLFSYSLHSWNSTRTYFVPLSCEHSVREVTQSCPTLVTPWT